MCDGWSVQTWRERSTKGLPHKGGYQTCSLEPGPVRKKSQTSEAENRFKWLDIQGGLSVVYGMETLVKPQTTAFGKLCRK